MRRLSGPLKCYNLLKSKKYTNIKFEKKIVWAIDFYSLPSFLSLSFPLIPLPFHFPLFFSIFFFFRFLIGGGHGLPNHPFLSIGGGRGLLSPPPGHGLVYIYIYIYIYIKNLSCMCVCLSLIH